MENQSVNHTRKRITWSLAIILPVLTLAGLHFFITYKANRILPALIAELSDGNYTFSAAKIRFNYLEPSIRMSGIDFHPVEQGLDETYTVKADSLYLSLASLIPLFTNKEINVIQVRVVRPDVEIRRNVLQKDSLQKLPLNSQVKVIQENAVKFLKILRVNTCLVKDARFRYYPFPQSDRRYNISNINLSISDFYVPENGNVQQGFDIEGKIHLSIQHPEMEIPEKLNSVQFESFEWDNSRHIMNLGKFVVRQRSMPPRSDSILVQLDTISLRHIYWDAWLDSGLVHLDTVIARNGNMYFESSRERKKSPKDSVDIRKLKVWDAIGELEVGYFSAHRISAGVINRQPGMERNNSLLGDSLIIHGLRIRPGNANPLHIQDLALGVRSFIDRGESNRYQSSFSGLRVSGDTMTLTHYMIESTKRTKMGPGSKLYIPKLTMLGFSVNNLVDKKASIREIRMDNPQLTMLSNIGKNQPLPKITEKTFSDIRPYMKAGRLVINNATITVRSKSDPGTVLLTQKLSAVILSKSVLASRSIDDVVSSFTRLNMDHFFLITPHASLEFFTGNIDYARKALHFSQVKSELYDHRVKADLYDVTVLGSADLHPFEKDVNWHMHHIIVDSGTVDMELDETKTEKNESQKLLSQIDSLSLRKIRFNLHKGQLTASAFLENLEAVDENTYSSNVDWGKFTASLDQVKVHSPRMDLASRKAFVASSGRSVFHDTRLSLNYPHGIVDISTPELQVSTEIHQVDPSRTDIGVLAMRSPDIKISLEKADTSEIVSDTATRIIRVSEYAFEDPKISVSVKDGNEVTEFHTSGKNVSGSGFVFHQKYGNSVLTMERLQSALGDTRIRAGGKEIFGTGSIRFDLRTIQKQVALPLQLGVENFSIGAVDYSRIRNNDTADIHTEGIDFGRITSLVIRKDSLINAAFKLPPAYVRPSTFRLRSRDKDVDIENFRGNTEEGYLMWDSFTLRNTVERDQFFAQQPYEKDYVTLTTGKMRADDIRPVIFGKDTTVYVRKLTVDPLNLKIERDKRKPDDTIAYRPLVGGMLRKRIPFPVKIDTMQVYHGVVWHNVIDEKTEKEGTIFFTEVNGLLRNVKNFDYQPSDSFRFVADSKLMGVAQLRVQYREDYNDTAQGFLLSARLGRMDMKELNRLIIPLASVRVDRGEIHSLSMRVKGNDRLAYGSMEMNYGLFKVSVLNQEDQRRDIRSWLANLVVRAKNNTTNIVYKERLRDKSVFNFWARISLSGLLTNLGVKKNSKQVKRYYYNLDKSQLPPDLY